MSTLDELWASADSGLAYVRGYARYVARLLEQIDPVAVVAAAIHLEEAWLEGRTIFVAGNGGSAATASHFATDLAWGRGKLAGKRPRIISLAANVPMMTAAANDVGYPHVFVEQLRGVFQPRDLLVAISASGNSDNLLQAIDYANEQQGVSIGLVGFDGGRMKGRCTLSLHVETKPGDYEPAEDAHHALCHMLASYVKRRIAHRARATELSGIAP